MTFLAIAWYLSKDDPCWEGHVRYDVTDTDPDPVMEDAKRWAPEVFEVLQRSTFTDEDQPYPANNYTDTEF